jgi:signal transduction histidine kinase
MRAVGKELENAGLDNGTRPIFEVIVEGERKALSLTLQAEVYRIACEILRNAFRHAGARRIEAEVRYAGEQLRVRIRDDGKGIDPEVLRKGRRQGHWGLPGVRERAQQIGAQLDFWSQAGAGTEVQLSIPAAIAYQDSQARPKRKFLRRG